MCTLTETSYAPCMSARLSKMKRMERGIMPSPSSPLLICRYVAAVPIVYVFPEPVCPYAKTCTRAHTHSRPASSHNAT
jgi:hypothetical protein